MPKSDDDADEAVKQVTPDKTKTEVIEAERNLLEKLVKKAMEQPKTVIHVKGDVSDSILLSGNKNEIDNFKPIDERLQCPPADPIENLCIPEVYTRHISDCCKYMDIDKLREKGRVIQVNLPEIFIPLYTDFPSWKRRKEDSEFLHSEQRNFNIEDLIAENDYLLIEGEAGSGKTTLLKHFAYMTINEKNWKNLDGYLPILIFLKDLKDADFGKMPAGRAAAESILANQCDLKIVKYFCNAGKAIILLDGLDEIAPELRNKVVQAFDDFRKSPSTKSPCPPLQKRESKGCKIILTGRPHGISGAVVERFGNRHVRVLSLNMKQVEEFITRWFQFAYDKDSKIGEKTARDMIGEIRAHQNIEKLIDNPLLLTAICILYHDGKKLPNQRAELYKKFTENLLARRFPEPEDIRVRYFLMALALEMHTERTKGIDRPNAIRIIETVYPPDENETKLDYKIRLNNIFDTIELSSGLLKIEGGHHSFIHLTFQEFFAAIGQLDKGMEYSEAIRNYWDDEWYREVIQLFVGYLSMESRGGANRIVRQILEKDEDKPFYRWRLACLALLDIHQNTREPQVVQLAKERLLSIFDTDIEPEARADAGEILGWLGDPRDLEEFIPIKGGEYELSLGKISIAPFEMSKYLVTNQWYAKFVKDGGYTNKEFWTEEGLKWLEYTGAKIPIFWHDRKWSCPNLPVVGVCWYEAAAFAKWLTITRNDGNIYRLPDENEWEAAAAGFEKRKYAWGNEFDENRCNSGKSAERTSSVGIFKYGNTPEGIADLTGNVWEYISSDYHKAIRKDDFPFEKEMMKLIYEIEINSGDIKKEFIDKYFKQLDEKNRSFPVLRGGGRDAYTEYCPSANRFGFYPCDRFNRDGFRLVRSV